MKYELNNANMGGYNLKIQNVIIIFSPPKKHNNKLIKQMYGQSEISNYEDAFKRYSECFFYYIAHI